MGGDGDKLPVPVKHLRHPAPIHVAWPGLVSLTDVAGSDCEGSNNKAADSENIRILIHFSY